MIDLPTPFTDRMRAQLGEEYAEFIKCYSRPAERAIRVNTLKISVEEFKKISPFALQPVQYEERGFFVDAPSLGKTIPHAAGLYYVQEPSAMFVAPKVKAKAGERTLDLCSAPGGKGTQIAQDMQGLGTLVLNEVIPSRRDILMQNVERLGVKGAAVSCAPPEFLADYYPEYFDKILVDAPCSGEGMFRKEENAVAQWSPEVVKMCAERQKKILDCADKMLCGGGRLVYSTCTFAPEEDEGQISDFLSSHVGYKLLETHTLYPHKIRGEGHFCAVLEKLTGERAQSFRPVAGGVKDKNILKPFSAFEEEVLRVRFPNIMMEGDKLFSLGSGEDITYPLPQNEKWRIRQGLFLGKLDGKTFTPSHALACRLTKAEARGVEVDDVSAQAYLKGLTFPCGGSGWYLVLWRGYPLGWCKVSGGVAKNHYPKGLRFN